MSRRHFDSTENAELRAKIDEAKRGLPLPQLLARLGLGECAKKSAHCPFHDDEHESFSVFQSNDGKGWQWKCHAGCGYGDEIAFLVKHFGISRREAIRRYLDMAGFPPSHSPKSHEYPVSPECPKCPESPESRESRESPVCPVSPVSNGQALDAKTQRFLESLALSNACARAGKNVDRKRFKLARYMRGIEKVIGRQLNTDELLVAFTKWYQVSQPFLDPAKTRDDHWIAFLAEVEKVRMPFGEGTLAKALDNVSKLSLDQLPVIPGYANPPEKCRRLVALHRELHRLSAKGTYFLAYRDAATSCKGLSHQDAHTITVGVLVRCGVVKILNKGEAGLNGGKAAEFRYLLPQAETMAEDGDDDEIPV
jgi:hypothetical protein